MPRGLRGEGGYTVLELTGTLQGPQLVEFGVRNVALDWSSTHQCEYLPVDILFFMFIFFLDILKYSFYIQCVGYLTSTCFL